ncbi:hypothetical protein [Sphingobacterium lactis]|uniref:hypothetical protein n=1 Tax=Sphingobacterium lactis TaxID=797291 RepID=UPI003DA5EA8A
MKRFISSYKLLFTSGVLMVLFSMQFTSCKKIEEGNVGLEGDGSTLIFRMTGVTDLVEETSETASPNQGEEKKASTKKSVKRTTEAAGTRDIVNLPGFGEVAQMTFESTYGDTEMEMKEAAGINNAKLAQQRGINTSTASGTRNSTTGSGAKYAASKPMKTGNKYRLLIMDTKNNILAQAVGTSGTDLKIPVEGNKTYNYVIYSFNDGTDPGAYNTTFTIGHNGKDFIYKRGTVAIGTGSPEKPYTHIEPIVMNHMLARIAVKFDASTYPGATSISTLQARFTPETMFHQANFDLKAGTMGALTEHGPGVDQTAYIAFVNEPTTAMPAGDPKIKVAHFYTAKFQPITSLKLNLYNLVVATSSGNKSYSSTTGFQFNFTTISPLAGKSTNAVINLNPSAPSVTGLTCANAVFTPATLTQGTPVTAGTTMTVPYTGGNGSSYNAQTITANGLTFTLAAGRLNVGSGNLVYTVTGTPTAGGNMNVAITFGGRTCTVVKAVTPKTATLTVNTSNCANITYNNQGTHLMMNVASNVQTVSYPVNVTGTGQYTATMTVEGLTFSGTKEFTTTGTNTMVLTASGSPTRAGTFAFTIPTTTQRLKVPVGNRTIDLIKSDGAYANTTTNGFKTQTGLANNGFVSLDAKVGFRSDTFFPMLRIIIGSQRAKFSSYGDASGSMTNYKLGNMSRMFGPFGAGNFFGYKTDQAQDLDDSNGHYRAEYSVYDNTMISDGMYIAGTALATPYVVSYLDHDNLDYAIFALWNAPSTTTYRTVLRTTPYNATTTACQ